MPVEIRPADVSVDADCEALARLRWTWRREFGEGEADGYDGFARSFAAWGRAHAASHRAWLAEESGRPIGMAWLGTIDRVPSPDQPVRRGGIVQNVYVLDDCRDRGVGRRLVDRVVAAAAGSGMDWVVVHPTERSQPFYRRAGFAPSDGLLELRP
jgi:GNAT superfamily N-acetyltransferase